MNHQFVAGRHAWIKSFVLCFALGAAYFASAQQATSERIENEITQASIEAHLQFLASDLLKGRDTPSEGLDIAASYIAAHFHRHGVKPFLPEGYMQEVHLKNSSPADEGRLEMDGETYFAPDQFLQLAGGNLDLSAKAVFVDYGTEADFDIAKTKGKIVIARGGKEGGTSARDAFVESRAKRMRAEKAGALAIVELYSSPQMSWTMLQFYLNQPRMELDMGSDDSDEGSSFPAFWLEDIGNKQLGKLRKYKGEVSIKMSGAIEEKVKSQNVVAWVEGTHPELKKEYVVYSGHYDHVGIGVPDETGDSIYNGTRDNAIGTMTVLEAAAFIAKEPLDRSAMFVLFTGEEKGLLGSEWFVAHHPLPLSDIVFCFNSDNAGYNNTEIATVVGLTRTTAGPLISAACADYGLEAIEDPEPKQNLFDRSDQVNFARVGIPALMYSLGLTAFDEEIRKYYHRPADNPDSVDYEYLHRFTKAYVKAAVDIGNMPERPFWVAGDKYYDAGEALYAP